MLLVLEGLNGRCQEYQVKDTVTGVCIGCSFVQDPRHGIAGVVATGIVVKME